MADFKLVISDPKNGKSYQKELKEPDSSIFIGKKIGEQVKGDEFGLQEYEFIITGGSDYCGFPMRSDVSGAGRKRILAVSGIGVGKIGKGIRQKKTVCGNTIHPRISQINLKILKTGKAKLAPEVAEGIKAKEVEAKEGKAELKAKETEAKDTKEVKATEETKKEKAEAKA